MCSQSRVEVGILLVCCQELCLTLMQHVLILTIGTAVQAGDVNARRRQSLAVLVCDNHMHGNLESALG